MQCHHGLCGGHFATDTTFRKILTASYYWPILFEDTKAYCDGGKLCQTCSRRNLCCGELHPICPTTTFENWGVDFVGPLPKSSRRNEYLIVATDYMTKWAEALSVKKATQTVASDFIFHHIVCRFGCPLEIVTDQGSHFVNGVVTDLINRLSVKHWRTTSYYPQVNGLVKKTNGILCDIIAKMIQDKRKTGIFTSQAHSGHTRHHSKLQHNLLLSSLYLDKKLSFQSNSKYYPSKLQWNTELET
jgi:transposase InsO family protein